MAAPMTCDGILDIKTREICASLQETYGIDPASLDTGIPSNRVIGKKVVREVYGKNDGRMEPEVRARALEICRAEFRRGDNSFCRFLAARIPMPILPDDFNPVTVLDEALRRDVARVVAVVGPRRADAAGEMERARQFYHWMTTPVEQAGLGIRFDAADASQPRTNSDVYRDRQATCIEFVNFYLMLADRAGLDVMPVEIYRRDMPHVAAGYVSHDGRVQALIDLNAEDGHGGGFMTKLPAGFVMAPITRLLLESYFLASLADKEEDPGRGEAWIDQAMLMNPDNYLILTNKAYFLHVRGIDSGDNTLLLSARGYLSKALENNPLYQVTRDNLAKISGQQDK